MQVIEKYCEICDQRYNVSDMHYDKDGNLICDTCWIEGEYDE